MAWTIGQCVCKRTHLMIWTLSRIVVAFRDVSATRYYEYPNSIDDNIIPEPYAKVFVVYDLWKPALLRKPCWFDAICIVGGVEKRQVGLRCSIDSIVKGDAPSRREAASERNKSSMLGWNSEKKKWVWLILACKLAFFSFFLAISTLELEV